MLPDSTPPYQHATATACSGVTNLVVIQPTPFCNISCTYCYLPQRDDRTILSAEKLELIFRKLTSFPTIVNQVTVVWHAGEPLVVGTAYYEAAFSRIREVCPAGLKIDHAFQTNGMLITDAWCDLFKRWDVRIGLSIDGPKRIHDLCRKTRRGGGTYDQTVRGIEFMRKHGIPFHVITVLTRNALLAPEEMFSFFKEFDIRDVGFNLDEREGIHTHSSLSIADDHVLLNFFGRLSELMIENKFVMAIRELEETLASIRYLQPEGPINNLVIPFGIITIDVHGGVYTFSPELAGYSSSDFASFSIGNIYRDDFVQLQDSPALKSMTDQINLGVSLCRDQCKYFAVCGGGAPSNKIFENGTFASTETVNCRLSKKRVTDFILSKVENLQPMMAETG